MAAYGAAASLKNTIQLIRQSYRISLDPLSQQVLQPAFEAMVRLQKVLLKLDGTSCRKMRTKVNALDDRIKEVVWEFEDVLESLYTDQILPQLESAGDHLPFSVDLQSLRQSVDCFVERLAVMEAEYDDELLNMPEVEGEPVSSRIDFCGINSEMVGLSKEFERVRDHLLAKGEGEGESEGEGEGESEREGESEGEREGESEGEREGESEGDSESEIGNGNGGNWLLVTGMAGVGKTTLAKKVFDDPMIQRHFKYRAWVKVGRKCESNETLRCILAQVDPNTHRQMLTQGEDDDDIEKLVGVLEERLKNKKCLIVLDDVWEWDTRVMDNLQTENVRILLTSRIGMVESPIQQLRLLNKNESEKLLGEKVFGEGGFPPHLDELGKKIAYKCEGFPLMIVTVAELLSKEKKTIRYWTEIAQKQHNSVFVNAYNQISEVLFPSYDYLAQYLKMFFLYLGAFLPYKNIDTDFVSNNFIAEGFLELNVKQTSEDFILDFMEKLDRYYHLVLFKLHTGSWFSSKISRVHSCWQHLCKKEASKIKFLHVLQSYDDVMRDQRRLCAHSHMLFAFNQVYDSIKSDCASTARSFLCLGPYNQYPVPIHAMNFKLLRVLSASLVRFYHIPLEIFKLICLRYLSLTCNQDLPVSISNLFHLQFLLIKWHLCIRKRGVVSYMPVTLWNMKELQYIMVMGRDLPIPNSDATLDKLSYLFGVSEKSCTREILKRIPNLKKLGIQVELKLYDDDDDSNSLSGLDYTLEELHNLEMLEYKVVNPDMKYARIFDLPMFQSSLTKLILNGSGCPWEHMTDIGLLLPNLMQLTLRCYACRGPEWDIESRCFLKLKILVIEDTDLVRWRAQQGSLPRLNLLSIRHCYKLQQLDWTSDPSMVTMHNIELVECNPLAVASAKQLKPESLFKVRCHSSY